MLGGKFNLGALMKGAQKFQEMVEKNKEELSKLEVVAESGAGMITVVMIGSYQIKRIDLSDELFKLPKEAVEEMIAGAINTASQKITQAIQNKMGDMSDLLGNFTDKNS